jgi:hypothetical protein
LQDLEQEHTLLIDEHGQFELVPYRQIDKAGGQERPVRAFVFERGGRIYVVYWHMSGEASMELPLERSAVRLMVELGKPLSLTGDDKGIRVPLGRRMYVECNGVSRARVIAAFQNAQIIG